MPCIGDRISSHFHNVNKDYHYEDFYHSLCPHFDGNNQFDRESSRHRCSWHCRCWSGLSVRFSDGRCANGNALGVPLNDAAIAVLESQQGKHRINVFTYRRKPLRSANQLAWRKTLKASGIEDFRRHDLRHTWASRLRQNDVSTWVLQELGGWKSESMVRRCAHLSVAHLQSYAERLNSVDTLKSVALGHKNGHSSEDSLHESSAKSLKYMVPATRFELVTL